MPPDEVPPADFVPASYRILVIDDDPAQGNLVTLILGRSSGLFVESAVGGVAGVAALEKTDFHLVIVDDMMPVMDGLEVVRHIRTHSCWDKMPILMFGVSGVIYKLAMDLGVDGWLWKPHTPQQLKDAARTLIMHRRCVPPLTFPQA